MSIIATAVKHLIAAGVSGDDLVRAVAEMEASAQPAGADRAADKRRAWDRERKRAAKAALSTGIPPDRVETVESGGKPLSLDKETSPRPPKEINLSPGVNTQARKDRVFVCPDGVDPQHWADLLVNRKRKRLANTITAYRGVMLALKRLSDDEWPPGRIVEFAAQRGWGAIFDPREHHGKMRNGSFGNGTADGNRGRVVDAAFGFIADGEHH